MSEVPKPNPVQHLQDMPGVNPLDGVYANEADAAKALADFREEQAALGVVKLAYDKAALSAADRGDAFARKVDAIKPKLPPMIHVDSTELVEPNSTGKFYNLDDVRGDTHSPYYDGRPVDFAYRNMPEPTDLANERADRLSAAAFAKQFPDVDFGTSSPEKNPIITAKQNLGTSTTAQSAVVVPINSQIA